MTQPCKDQKDLYRQQYRQGQMLRSRDLSDQVDYEERLRWWHNRAVHHAYGISYGCRAEKKSDSTDAIVVRAGLGYDCFGRPLRLSADAEIPVPTRLQNEKLKQILFMHELPEKDHAARSRINAGCVAKSGEENSRPAVEFDWKPVREFSIRDGVAIATVDFELSGSVGEITQTCLPRARSDRNPYLVNGQTILGQTAWEVWKEPLSGQFTRGQFFTWGVQVKIDTRAAGFTGEPIYVAQTAPFVGPFISYVTRVSEVGFTFRTVLGHEKVDEVDVAEKKVFLELAKGLEWLSRLRQFVAVKWIGLEPIAETHEQIG